MLALAVPKMGSLLLDAARTSRRERIIRYCLKGDRYCRRLMDSWAFRFQPVWLLLMVSVFLVISLIPPLANRLPVQLSSDWPLAPLEFAAAKGYRATSLRRPIMAPGSAGGSRRTAGSTPIRVVSFSRRSCSKIACTCRKCSTRRIIPGAIGSLTCLPKKVPRRRITSCCTANVQLWKDFLKSKVVHPLYSDEQPTGPDGNREGWILLSSDQARKR